MIDLVKLLLKAGDGGNGRISFRREKFVTHGGPDGGNGGEGGQIIIQAVAGINTLRPFSGIKLIKAESGMPGARRKMSGVKGDSITIDVPVGTVVWLVGENRTSFQRTQNHGVRQLANKAEIEMEKFYVEKEQQPPPPREKEELSLVTDRLSSYREIWQVVGDTPAQKSFADGSQAVALVELTEAGQRAVLCQGGFGGKGNFLFRGSTNVTPLEAEYGSYGEQKEVILELRLLADVGLVGLPNAGKSTLLSKITKATPKIGDYPFTTIEPNLGVLTVDRLGAEFAQVSNKTRQDIVIADIPGLIEGASEGKGLGHDFLRHIENCRRLVYVLSLPEAVVFDETLTDLDKAQQVWQQYQTLKQELADYGQKISQSNILSQKPYTLTLNKIDIYSPELIDAVVDIFTQNDEAILPFSGYTSDGLAKVVTELLLASPAEPVKAEAKNQSLIDEADHLDDGLDSDNDEG